MKKLLSAAALALSLTACTTNHSDMNNPFLHESPLPHGAFEFDKLKIEHYMPAFEAGMKEEDAEIDAIINNPAEPDFENTIAALDKTGKLLGRVSSIFYNLLECDGTDEMLDLSVKIQPMMSEHSLKISLNEKLFKRVEAVWNKYKDNHEALTEEQFRLLSCHVEYMANHDTTLAGAANSKLLGVINQLIYEAQLRLDQRLGNKNDGESGSDIGNVVPPVFNK